MVGFIVRLRSRFMVRSSVMIGFRVRIRFRVRNNLKDWI